MIQLVRIIATMAVLNGLGMLPVFGQSQNLKALKKIDRERFTGLHFDFHAMPDDTLIGKTFTYGLIDTLLSEVKPDFIQVDCKGHPGISSYPTEAGNAPARFEKDILRIWREVTRKHDIPLYMHYSGVCDYRAIQQHPEWARINSDSSRNGAAVSLLGGYPGELLQPQLRELALKYDVDGAWIDGDCWMLGPDYSPAVISAFTKETGIPEAPRQHSDPHYFEWMEFNRKLFRNYIRNYVEDVHRADPDFKITSNWSFSSMMPEKVDIPVDFLSGDVAGVNSLYSSAFESRCLALQGKPWDLMSWSFAWKKNLKATKSVAQLQQEAAEVLAMGGGFQTYWQQNRDGTPEPYQFKKMGELVRFAKERKEFCYQASVVPQIGLLYSTYAWKRIPTSGLYSGHSQGAMKGILNMLLDAQLPVEILMDHQLAKRIHRYPVLVLPEWEGIDAAHQTLLTEYVKEGGHLIIAGAKATLPFMKELGVEPIGAPDIDTAFYAGFAGEIFSVKTNFQPVKSTSADTLGQQLSADGWRFPTHLPLASIRKSGKGKIAGVYMDIGNFYNTHKNYALPSVFKTFLAEMGSQLTSRVSGSGNIHQVLTTKNGKTYLHLINTTGAHDNPNVMVYGEIPPLSTVSARIYSPTKPQRVTLQPENQELPFNFKNNVISIDIPDIAVYAIVEIN